jgi:hypothetical protein
MCLELGINVDSEHTRGNLSPQEIELRRRIFWYCYCLDKIQSAEWERAWILPASMARVCLPQTLPEDDEDERLIVNYYYEKIKLTLLVEHGIQIRAKLSIDKNGVLSSAYEQMEDFYSKVIAWRDGFVGLPKQGIEHCVSVAQVMDLPSDSPNLSHLFVLFYTILIDILFWLPETPVRLHEQRIYASQLIRCIKNLCNAPGVIARYEFLVHALISAIRVQGCCLEDPDHIISQQSWYYFNQSLELLQHFRKYSVIPDNATIIAKIPAIRKYSQDFQSFYNEYNFQPLQFIENINSPTDSGTPSMKSPVKIYSNNVETNSFIPALNFPQPDTQESPEIGMNCNFADLAGVFGDNINDFTNRRQLWENELQQLNVYNTYDPCSRPMTPDDQLINANWQDTTASTDFAWGLPIINPHPEMQYSPVYPVYTTDQHLSAPCSFPNTSSHPSTPEATNSVELNDLSNNAYSPYHSIPSYTQGTYYTH